MKVIIWIGMVTRRTLRAEKIVKEVERLANEGLIGRVSFQTGRTRLAEFAIHQHRHPARLRNAKSDARSKSELSGRLDELGEQVPAIHGCTYLLF